MKLGFITIVLYLALLSSCCRGHCKPCKPENDGERDLVEFDTTDNIGFRWDELDSIYLYRYNDQMIIMDSDRCVFTGQKILDLPITNSIKFGLFGKFRDGSGTPTYYGIRINGHPKRYFFKNFQFKFVPKNPKHCCECDRLFVQSVTINDSIINIEQWPFKITK